MRAGRLRHRLTVLRYQPSTDDEGSVVGDYQPVGKVWGRVLTESGQEYFEAGAARGEVDIRVEIRLPADIRVSDRLQMGARIFDVQTQPLDKIGRGREAELSVKEYRQ